MERAAENSNRREAAGLAVWGVAAGTEVLTSDGAIPIEFVEEGERVVTRNGNRTLRNKRRSLHSGRMIRIDEDAFGPGRPQRSLMLLPGTFLLLPRQRNATCSHTRTLERLSDLADGKTIHPVEVHGIPVFRFGFDQDEIAYLYGAEIFCPAGSSPCKDLIR